MDPREANGIATKNTTNPEIMQPQRAVDGSLAAMHRAWKSSAAMLPTPRIKIVLQFQKIPFGLRDGENGQM